MIKIKRSWIIGPLVLVGIIAVIIGYQLKSSSTQRVEEKVRLGYMPFASDLAVYVAVEKGYFEKEGVDVELVQFKASNENLNALLSGRIDVTGMIGLPTLFSAFEKAPDQFRIFLGTAETSDHWASAFLVPPDSPIKSLSDLKNKVVGTYSGTTQLINLKSMLRQFMNPDTDVTIQQVRADLQLPALQSKQFDSLFTIEPHVTIAVEKGIGIILEENPRYKYILQPFPVTSNCFSKRFLNQNPEIARAIYLALVKASEYINKNESEAKRLLPKYTPLDESLAQKCHLYEWWTPSKVDYAAIQKLAEHFYQQGLLSTQLDTSKMFVEWK